MASVAEVRRLFLADGPDVSLVAVLTIEPGLCHMKVVLSNFRFVPVAVFQTVLVRRLYFSMRVVAVKTV